jgi:hypothetical protein
LSTVFFRSAYDDLTHYVAEYFALAVENAEKLGFKVVDLYGADANRQSLIDALSRFTPKAVVFGTHGFTNELRAYDGAVIIGCSNDDLFKGKTVFALACQTADGLGRSSVEKGCLAYFGWMEDFIAIFDDAYMENPLADPYAQSFFNPVVAGVNVMLHRIRSGATIQTVVRDVYETVITAFNAEIEYWRKIPTLTASQMLTYLIHDRDTFIPITTTRVYSPPSTITVQPSLTSLLVIAALAFPLFLEASS